ncbi:MAG: hypothetical protein JRC53_01095 [Deltaproteobacteria bacterium]|nr:hypothetical protein [Deltaproteobacteria bacterium]
MSKTIRDEIKDIRRRSENITPNRLLIRSILDVLDSIVDRLPDTLDKESK